MDHPRRLILTGFVAFAGLELVYAGLSISNVIYLQISLTSSNATLQKFNALVWLPRSEVQIGIGLCTIAVLSLLIERRWSVSSSSVNVRKLGEATRKILLVMVVVCLTGFAFFAGYVVLWSLIPPPHPFYHLFDDPSFPGGGWFGVPAAGLLALAAVAALLRWIDDGIVRSLGRVISLVVSPPAFVYALGTLVFKPSEMVWHVTNFLSLGLMPGNSGFELGYFPVDVSPSFDNGIDLLSNWLLLMVAGFLTCIGLWGYARSRASVPREPL